MQELVIQFVAAAVATVSFSLLFGVPRHYYPSGIHRQLHHFQPWIRLFLFRCSRPFSGRCQLIYILRPGLQRVPQSRLWLLLHIIP